MNELSYTTASVHEEISSTCEEQAGGVQAYDVGAPVEVRLLDTMKVALGHIVMATEP